MTFLPLVEREMRVATRSRTMVRVRWWAALLGMGVAVISLAVVATTRGGSRLGNPFFQVLSGYAFALCLMAGVVLTADCLSSEKREGTLGLLFLTDLKG